MSPEARLAAQRKGGLTTGARWKRGRLERLRETVAELESRIREEDSADA
jgi:hypothetical protein